MRFKWWCGNTFNYQTTFSALFFVHERFTCSFLIHLLPSPFSTFTAGLKILNNASCQLLSTMVLMPSEELIRNVHGSSIKKQIIRRFPKILVAIKELLPTKRMRIAKVKQPQNSTNQEIKLTLMHTWHNWDLLFLWYSDRDVHTLEFSKFLKCKFNYQYSKYETKIIFAFYVGITQHRLYNFDLPIGMPYSSPVKQPFHKIRVHYKENNWMQDTWNPH